MDDPGGGALAFGGSGARVDLGGGGAGGVIGRDRLGPRLCHRHDNLSSL